MPRKRNLSNVKERCRICLADHGCMSNLSDEVIQLRIKDLVKCTSINVKDEHDLPTKVCHVCLYKLDMWIEFKEEFVHSTECLLDQLEVSGSSNNMVKVPEIKGSGDDAQQSLEDSLSDNVDKNKSKMKNSPLTPLQFANVNSPINRPNQEEIYISDDDPTSSKDSSQVAPDVSNSDKHKNDGEKRNGDHNKVTSSLKPKSCIGKRGRTTERRKASTKRWVARKKALLAATGENVSDTDSAGSDDILLSPVQKARAKTYADKEVIRQKRLVKELKNLETNMTDKYSAIHNSDNFMNADTDSDLRRTRRQSTVDSKNMLVKDGIKQEEMQTLKEKSQSRDLKQKENMPLPSSQDIDAGNIPKNGAETTEEIFLPRSVKAEIEIGDATYTVASTLILTEPHYLNKVNLNNLTKDCKDGSTEQNSQEKNTDIIDAVQLRRINPLPRDSNDKKYIERCLNIEVEGTEIEALKRVQVELAGFVEKEMKQRLFGANNDVGQKPATENVCKSSYQTLDQQLKNIIEKAIKKNFESSVMRTCGPNTKLYNQDFRSVSPAFVKAALNSKKYQPKVVLKRLDVPKESRNFKINNTHVLNKRNVKSRLGGPFSMVAHKRQSVLPIKFNDYNTSPLDTGSDLSEDMDTSETSRLGNSCNVQKLHKITADEQLIVSTKQADILQYKETSSKAVVTVPVHVRSSMAIEQKPEKFSVLSNMDSSVEKYICNQSMNDFKETTVQGPLQKPESSTLRTSKDKVMRCKRCHEIVKARFVKDHICKHFHKCYVCNSTFRTEKLLVRHLQSHDQSEFNIENITKVEPRKSTNINEPSFSRSEIDQAPKMESSPIVKTYNARISNGQTEKATKVIQLDSTKIVEKPKETYTCFICDKIFTDEEVLKNHLQKHCDDMSEDEQSTGKEQYQCAICGDSMDSGDALEAHVEKHLFDDEDDNPNLISIASENERQSSDLCQCPQCEETFNSKLLLEMHMQAHEEEVAIAEWEKQGIKSYEHQCIICNDLFETEEELSEHLDVHNGNAHVCQLCEKPCRSLEDLQRHVETH